jgi:hypothetical protein
VIDHAWSDIAGENLDAAFSKKDGIEAGAAVEFEDTDARAKDGGELAPNGLAAGFADDGVSKVLFVRVDGRVPEDPSGMEPIEIDGHVDGLSLPEGGNSFDGSAIPMKCMASR